MIFDVDHFLRFCALLRFESKEQGLIRLDRLLGTQRYFLEQVAKGLKDGVHFFVVLKGRQVGITTISLALDLYWQFAHKGWTGTLVADSDENREMFRSTLAAYVDGLPRHARPETIGHNRYQFVFKNRSRLLYQTAGKKKRLGQGKAITYLHGTEVASWGNEEGLASLLSSLAETNPERLYIFESTAQGFNMFHDMYKTARKSRTQRGIFIGWWQNELYSVANGSQIHRVYWDGKLKGEEKVWVRLVKQLYGVEINSRQIAWYRWKLAEVIKDEMLMKQEFPCHEDEAFIVSGTGFFSTASITRLAKIAKDREPQYWRYDFGALFQDTQVLASTARMATLKVWAEPVPNGWYVIGADPAFGSSDWKDGFCVQVYRVWINSIEQVAEFHTTEMTTYQFAWVIAHLAGAYRNSTVNLEMNGPGQAVQNELDNLRRLIAFTPGKLGADLRDVIGSMTSYIWRRDDSLNPLSNSKGWVTTSRSKEVMLAAMRDAVMREIMSINSMECLDEMKVIVREDGFLGAPGRAKDDRVIASALAVAAYARQLLPRLLAANVVRDAKLAPQQQDAPPGAPQRVVSGYLQQIGFTPGAR